MNELLPIDFYSVINLKIKGEISKNFDKLINVSKNDIWGICYKFIDEIGINNSDTFSLELNDVNSLVLTGEIGKEHIQLEIVFTSEVRHITISGLNMLYYEQQSFADFGSEEKIFSELRGCVSFHNNWLLASRALGGKL